MYIRTLMQSVHITVLLGSLQVAPGFREHLPVRQSPGCTSDKLQKGFLRVLQHRHCLCFLSMSLRMCRLAFALVRRVAQASNFQELLF